jgi:hypothetical protein
MFKTIIPCTPRPRKPGEKYDIDKDEHLQHYIWFRQLGWEFTKYDKYVHEDGRTSWFWVLEVSEAKREEISRTLTDMTKYEKFMRSRGIFNCLNVIFPGTSHPVQSDWPERRFWWLVVKAVHNPYYAKIKAWCDEQMTQATKPCPNCGKGLDLNATMCFSCKLSLVA